MNSYKYNKYKLKYINYKNQHGAGGETPETPEIPEIHDIEKYSSDLIDLKNKYDSDLIDLKNKYDDEFKEIKQNISRNGYDKNKLTLILPRLKDKLANMKEPTNDINKALDFNISELSRLHKILKPNDEDKLNIINTTLQIENKRVESINIEIEFIKTENLWNCTNILLLSNEENKSDDIYRFQNLIKHKIRLIEANMEKITPINENIAALLLERERFLSDFS